jgi:hypothetical protein
MYSEKISPSTLQDMAVRFGIAVSKEQYDFTNRQTTDRICWYVMFILSTYTLFGSRLRHQLYKIDEHCFSQFSSFLLESLKRLL